MIEHTSNELKSLSFDDIEIARQLAINEGYNASGNQFMNSIIALKKLLNVSLSTAHVILTDYYSVKQFFGKAE